MTSSASENPRSDVTVNEQGRVTIPAQIRRAAALWTRTRSLGLSLGDRCCLALGARLELPTVTADTVWAGLDLDFRYG